MRSSTGQVLLHDFKTGQKWKSLLRGGGQAAGNLSFSRLSPGQLAGGNSSGQLLAWDLDRMELADELEVHKVRGWQRRSCQACQRCRQQVVLHGAACPGGCRSSTCAIHHKHCRRCSCSAVHICVLLRREL
jgi:hypothetical protein